MSNRHLAILGREKDLSLAELERVYGAKAVQPFGDAALLSIEPDINNLGGTPKTAELIKFVESSSAKVLFKEITQIAYEQLNGKSGKLKFGISSYTDKLSLKVVKSLVINIAKGLRKEGIKVRAVPNRKAELNSAQVWHNRLDKQPNLELVVLAHNGKLAIGRTIGIQDIKDYTRRDRHKPVRDMEVGMLPPKLAKLMVNLAKPEPEQTILDPFCGTGTVLMEGMVAGYKAYGTDISTPMVNAATQNTAWLSKEYGIAKSRAKVEMQDARKAEWSTPIDVVVSETYLGPPLNRLPEKEHLKSIVYEVDELLTDSFTNLAEQLKAGTTLCLAVPAWYDEKAKKFTHLPLVDDLGSLGYNLVDLKSVGAKKLIYHRPGQTVARQILIMTRK